MHILHPRSANSTVANAIASDHTKQVLKSLTLEEKVSLLTARDFSSTRDIPRLNVPSIKTSDSTSAAKGASLGNPLSTACFPNTAALAATWDRDLIFEMGKAVAGQARYKSAQVLLGPTVNIHRHPRGGRNFESFSEDPVLTGQLAASMVNGIQSTGVAACLKHFVCNDGDTARKRYNAIVDERTLREIYLAPFQWAIREANPALLMSAYNIVNGTYCCETPLYKEVVQKEWGFQGSWMSDWYGTESTVAALEAGLDIEMPGPSKARGQRVIQALERGEISIDVINERALGVLKIAQRTADVHSSANEQVGLDQTTNDLIRKIAQESIVLLKNKDGILPLSTSTAPALAVIGEHAIKYCGGGGSASGIPQYYKTPLSAIEAACPGAGLVKYSPGVTLHRCIPMAPPPLLTTDDGEVGVKVVFSANQKDGGPRLVHQEKKPVPIVFVLGHIPEGLDEKHGFTYEITTNLKPRTSGNHTLGVLATGAFSLLVDDQEVLSQSEPAMSVEDFLFVPHTIEKRCSVSMNSDQPYHIRLVTHSRRQLNIDEPTPHSSKLCFLEEFSDEANTAEASAVAAAGDVSIVFAGRNAEWESEGSDMSDISLPKQQNALIRSVAASSKRTVVVLMGGNPFDVSEWIDQVDAVIFAHYPGQEGGEAIADILFGNVCPSGRLPMSWPWKQSDSPADSNFPCTMRDGVPEIRYEERLRVGYRHFWSHEAEREKAIWDFGYGLSYTSFALCDVRVIEAKGSENEPLLIVEVLVENTGHIAGAEVVQIYIEDIEASVWRPKKELKGFDKVYLQPGERKVTKIELLKKYALSFWDETGGEWLAESGEFNIHVGELVAHYRLAEDFRWSGL